jgi:hypothetical protein
MEMKGVENMIKQIEGKIDISLIPQYSLGKILLVWAAAAIPMGILGWVVAPALAHRRQQSSGWQC